MGRHEFTLYKFQSMRINAFGPGVTKAGDPRLTRLGASLRKYRLDEAPQLYNVVRGDMSLVGPRPKLPKFEQMQMDCRPGVTGTTTLAFANEEQILKDIPLDQMDRFHVEVLSPAKRSLDESHQSKATFASDFGLLVRTVFRISAGKVIALVPDIQPDLPRRVRSKRASEVRFQTRGDEAPSCDSVAS